MAGAERPLSPHLQVYRWRVTMLNSIIHRVSGVALGTGTVLLAGWLLAVASGPEAFSLVKELFGHWFGRLVLFGFSWGLIYHLLSGIRYLFWTAGLGFEVDVAEKWGWAILAASVFFTLLAWGFGYGLLGV